MPTSKPLVRQAHICLRSVESDTELCCFQRIYTYLYDNNNINAIPLKFKTMAPPKPPTSVSQAVRGQRFSFEKLPPEAPRSRPEGANMASQSRPGRLGRRGRRRRRSRPCPSCPPWPYYLCCTERGTFFDSRHAGERSDQLRSSVPPLHRLRCAERGAAHHTRMLQTHAPSLSFLPMGACICLLPGEA